MTEYFPVEGDYVEVVHRGEVTKVYPNCFYLTNGHGEVPIYAKYDTTKSVKKIQPPVPTAPGSIILVHNKYYRESTMLVRSDDNLWRYVGNGHVASDPKDYEQIEVLFDAGAVND